MHDAYLAQLPADLRPDPPPRRESTWWRFRGTDVHVERVGADDAPDRAIVLHGAGGHAAAVWPFAAVAARHGYHVVVPDLPGYGRTRVPRRGAIRYDDWVDLACALAVAERHRHDGPLLLVGASMGGMLAYEVATRTDTADRVLATCLLDPRDAGARRHIAHHPVLGAAARPALRLLAGPLSGVVVPLRWLTRMHAIANQPDLVRLVLADRRGGGNRMPLGFLRSFLDSVPAVEPENASGVRFVLAHPGADRWTPTEVSLRFLERIAAPAELVSLAGAGHYPVESPGVYQLVRTLRELHRAGTPVPDPPNGGASTA